MKNNLATSIVSIVILFIIFSFSFSQKSLAASSFTDVRVYESEIIYLSNAKILQGYPNNLFKPDLPLKRIQAVQMILSAKGLSPEKLTEADAVNPNFTDIKPGDYGYPAVAKGVELGIISGKTNSKNGSKYFDPWGTLTRSQMAKILVSAYHMDLKGGSNFKDVLPNHWAYPYISSLVKNNITIGYGNNTFGPNDQLSRAHFSVFLARQLDERFKPVKGFSLDKHKKYIYQYENGEEVTAIFSKTQDNYDMWIYKFQDGMVTKGFKEDKAFLTSGIPETNMINYELKFPIEVGKTWDDVYFEGDETQGTKTITSLQKTIQTPAGTFTNAVEVKDSRGYYSYYVRGIGHILTKKETDNGLTDTIILKAVLDPNENTFTTKYPTSYMPQPGNLYFYKVGNGEEVILQALESLNTAEKYVKLSGDLLGLYNGLNITFTEENNQLFALFGNQKEPQLKYPIQNGLKWTYPMNYGGLVVNMQNVKVEITSTTATITTPYATYKNVVKVKVTPPSGYDVMSGWNLLEHSKVDPFSVKAVYNYYAQGIGLVRREVVTGTNTVNVLELIKVQ